MKPRLILTAFLLLSSLAGSAQTLTVWPGDANNNGEANHVDLLYLGLNFGFSGPGRDSVSIAWTGHSAQPWGGPVMPNPNAAYSDCNGDSAINQQDVDAILVNFGLRHGVFTPDSSSIGSNFLHPLMTLDIPVDSIATGTRDTFPLLLGTVAAPVDSLYGLAFTLTYDTALVDSAYAIFDNSWLSSGGGTALLKVENTAPGMLKAAVTRFDRINALSGAGGIGSVVVVMDDNLKTAATTETLNFEFTEVLALSASGTVKKVSPMQDSVTIYIGNEPPAQTLRFEVYPNPAGSWIQIDVADALQTDTQVSVTDLQGRIVRAFRLPAGSGRVNFSDLPSGLYLLQVQQGEKTGFRKIEILR